MVALHTGAESKHLLNMREDFSFWKSAEDVAFLTHYRENIYTKTVLQLINNADKSLNASTLRLRDFMLHSGALHWL